MSFKELMARLPQVKVGIPDQERADALVSELEMELSSVQTEARSNPIDNSQLAFYVRTLEFGLELLSYLGMRETAERMARERYKPLEDKYELAPLDLGFAS